MNWLKGLLSPPALLQSTPAASNQLADIFASVERIEATARDDNWSEEKLHTEIAQYLKSVLRENVDLRQHGDSVLKFVQSRIDYHQRRIEQPEPKIFDEFITACFHGRLQEVNRLLDGGIDPNGIVDGHRTALGAAIENAQYDVVQLLLNRGADVNASPSGVPALHHAIDIESDYVSQHQKPFPGPSLVRLVLEFSPDLSQLDYAGRTALGLARRCLHKQAIQWLEERSAPDLDLGRKHK